jgi:hypothetical protein
MTFAFIERKASSSALPGKRPRPLQSAKFFFQYVALWTAIGGNPAKFIKKREMKNI